MNCFETLLCTRYRAKYREKKNWTWRKHCLTSIYDPVGCVRHTKIQTNPQWSNVWSILWERRERRAVGLWKTEPLLLSMFIHARAREGDKGDRSKERGNWKGHFKVRVTDTFYGRIEVMLRIWKSRWGLRENSNSSNTTITTITTTTQKKGFGKKNDASLCNWPLDQTFMNILQTELLPLLSSPRQDHVS